MPTNPIYAVVRDEKRQRAARYREEAARLETIARAGADRANCHELLDMATQYQGLAQRLEADLGAS